jgi:hypothetical protein
MLERPQMSLSESSSARKGGLKVLHSERLTNNYRKRVVGVIAAKGGGNDFFTQGHWVLHNIVYETNEISTILGFG